MQVPDLGKAVYALNKMLHLNIATYI